MFAVRCPRGFSLAARTMRQVPNARELATTPPRLEKTVLVSGIDGNTAPHRLRDVFSSFGQVTDVTIPKRIRMPLLHYGFVTFADDVEAEMAVAAANGRELDGNRVKVCLAAPQRRYQHVKWGEKLKQESWERDRRLGKKREHRPRKIRFVRTETFANPDIDRIKRWKLLKRPRA
eukprot:TRINITY_DN44063_c0_g1_i1.p2 TRINITY_DN44063_c0_g1~~TRINITY_DN44063_c0_g1_i1.p2  ORF type:complete len:175 (+),score=21.53 TRINITY_DN44063_c0_g1_i1:28-552(+)